MLFTILLTPEQAKAISDDDDSLKSFKEVNTYTSLANFGYAAHSAVHRLVHQCYDIDALAALEQTGDPFVMDCRTLPTIHIGPCPHE